MAVDNQTIKDAGTEGTPLERHVNSHVGNFIHLFLTVLAILVMGAACVALFQIVHYGFPQLWRASDEYQTLHQLLQNILLLAIAGELGLLLLFHRASAAVEVVMFVIARRMVAHRRDGLRSSNGLDCACNAHGRTLLLYPRQAKIIRGG
ncbi:MAG TPA: hypothetical protein VGN44_05950 [Candidatus Angelobacter sp.]